MKIAITASGGFIGSTISRVLGLQGNDIISPGREVFSLDDHSLASTLAGADVIIHLSGAPLIRRWTRKNRNEIYDSRVNTTRKIVGAMQYMNPVPRTFICASAVGIYSGEGVHDETSTNYSEGFLGKLCRDWEAEASRTPASCRSIIFRFGVVLGSDGGALKKMLPFFRMGLGGRIAGGQQKMSWVHIEDVARAFEFVLKTPAIEGPVNICSPLAVSNSEFTKTLAGVLSRPAVIPIPKFMLRLVYGKGSVVLTKNQHAVPARLEAHDFRFRFAELEGALRDITGQAL